MKKTVVILLLVFLPFLVWSQSKRELEEFARKQEQEREQLKQEQKKGLSDLLAESEKYVKAEQEADVYKRQRGAYGSERGSLCDHQGSDKRKGVCV